MVRIFGAAAIVLSVLATSVVARPTPWVHIPSALALRDNASNSTSSNSTDVSGASNSTSSDKNSTDVSGSSDSDNTYYLAPDGNSTVSSGSDSNSTDYNNSSSNSTDSNSNDDSNKDDNNNDSNDDNNNDDNSNSNSIDLSDFLPQDIIDILRSIGGKISSNWRSHAGEVVIVQNIVKTLVISQTNSRRNNRRVIQSQDIVNVVQQVQVIGVEIDQEFVRQVISQQLSSRNVEEIIIQMLSSIIQVVDVTQIQVTEQFEQITQISGLSQSGVVSLSH